MKTVFLVEVLFDEIKYPYFIKIKDRYLSSMLLDLLMDVDLLLVLLMDSFKILVLWLVNDVEGCSAFRSYIVLHFQLCPNCVFWFIHVFHVLEQLSCAHDFSELCYGIFGLGLTFLLRKKISAFLKFSVFQFPCKNFNFNEYLSFMSI